MPHRLAANGSDPSRPFASWRLCVKLGGGIMTEMDMVGIGNMLWRIGDLLDIDRQITWTREAGFEGVAFHAHAGVPGRWRGVAPETCRTGDRKRLADALGAFCFAEIHAPFAIELSDATLTKDIAALQPVLTLAGDVGVGIVTVHANLPESEIGSRVDWFPHMRRLDQAASEFDVTIVLEVTHGFDVVKSWDLARIGVNLDVGHMYLASHRHVLNSCGGIGNLIRRLEGVLRHLHLHDVSADGATDHIEIGTGVVDFEAIANALQDIGYAHDATLELNPDRVSPEGIRASADRAQAYLKDLR